MGIESNGIFELINLNFDLEKIKAKVLFKKPLNQELSSQKILALSPEIRANKRGIGFNT